MSKESNARQLTTVYISEAINAPAPIGSANTEKAQALEFALRAAMVEMIDAKNALIEVKRAFGDATINRVVPSASGCIHGLTTQISNAKKLLQ
jgi:hypothetical protein